MMPARLFWLPWLPSVLSPELVGLCAFFEKIEATRPDFSISWWFVLSKFILHAVLCGKMIGRSLGVSECYSARCTGLGEKEGFWQILCTCMKNEEVTNITLLELYLLFDYLFEHVWNNFGFSFGGRDAFKDAKYLFKRKKKQQNVAKPSLRTYLGLEKHKQASIFWYGFGPVGHVFLMSINSGDSNVLFGSILYPYALSLLFPLEIASVQLVPIYWSMLHCIWYIVLHTVLKPYIFVNLHKILNKLTLWFIIACDLIQ